jgi:hypothetical protein
MALTDNLISYWKLDESSGNASDSVGSNTLTNNNSVAYTSAKINNGADFGDTGNTKSLITTNTLGIDGGNMSFSCWVNKNKNITNLKYVLAAYQENNTSKVEYSIGFYSDGGNEYVRFQRGKVGVGDQVALKTITLSTGTWYHLVGTYDGTNIRLYIDGTLEATTAASGDGSNAGVYTAGFSIGNNNDDSSIIENALIVDEVGVWSRALSSTEISQLYNNGAGLQYPFNTGNFFKLFI